MNDFEKAYDLYFSAIVLLNQKKKNKAQEKAKEYERFVLEHNIDHQKILNTFYARCC